MGRYTSPNCAKISGYSATTHRGTRYSTSSAAYLPRITWKVDSGREYRSWSVFCRRSSARERMVKIGMTTTKARLPKLSTYSKLLTASSML